MMTMGKRILIQSSSSQCAEALLSEPFLWAFTFWRGIALKPLQEDCATASPPLSSVVASSYLSLADPPPRSPSMKRLVVAAALLLLAATRGAQATGESRASRWGPGGGGLHREATW